MESILHAQLTVTVNVSPYFHNLSHHHDYLKKYLTERTIKYVIDNDEEPDDNLPCHTVKSAVKIS